MRNIEEKEYPRRETIPENKTFRICGPAAAIHVADDESGGGGCGSAIKDLFQNAQSTSNGFRAVVMSHIFSGDGSLSNPLASVLLLLLPLRCAALPPLSNIRRIVVETRKVKNQKILFYHCPRIA